MGRAVTVNFFEFPHTVSPELQCKIPFMATQTAALMLPVQCRMARAALGLSVRKLAAAARVAPQTIVRFERGEKLRPRTVTSLRQVLEAGGVEFTSGRKPGVKNER